MNDLSVGNQGRLPKSLKLLELVIGIGLASYKFNNSASDKGFSNDLGQLHPLKSVSELGINYYNECSQLIILTH